MPHPRSIPLSIWLAIAVRSAGNTFRTQVRKFDQSIKDNGQGPGGMNIKFALNVASETADKLVEDLIFKARNLRSTPQECQSDVTTVMQFVEKISLVGVTKAQIADPAKGDIYKRAMSIRSNILIEMNYKFQISGILGVGDKKLMFSEDEKIEWIKECNIKNVDQAFRNFQANPRYDWTNQEDFREKWRSVHGRKRGRPPTKAKPH